MSATLSRLRGPLLGGTLMAALLSCAATPVRAEGLTATELAAAVRDQIARKSLAIRPHIFHIWRGTIGYTIGGMDFSSAEWQSPAPFDGPIYLIGILEAEAKGLSPEQQKLLRDSCRQDIMGLVQKELDLIASHTGNDEELRKKFQSLDEQAQKAFEEAIKVVARKSGLQDIGPLPMAGARRRVDFVTRPEGAIVYVMNAGNYIIYQKLKARGLKQDLIARWHAVDKEAEFGDQCQYYVCAKWPDGQVSAVQEIDIPQTRRVVLAPKK
jgi:hypothetical protein